MNNRRLKKVHHPKGLYASGSGDAPEIISDQVDNHDMFGAVLFRFEKRTSAGRVGGEVAGPKGRAFDG